MKKSFLSILNIILIISLLAPYIVRADDEKYDPKDLSDYFGTMKACTDDRSENDCRNGNEYKFYLKMYDIYFLYKKKYNVKLDLPLIMATLYYGSEELPTVFKNNLNSYDRSAVKNGNSVTNLDWEYDFKNDSCYTYLNANDFSYDMQILAKNMVKKEISYNCSEGDGGKAEDIEISNYSTETLKCEKGEYVKDSVSASYKLDLEKYDDFLLDYIKLKYHTPGVEVKSCSTSSSSSSGSSSGSAPHPVTASGKEAIDKMNEIALKEAAEVNAGGEKYWSWYGFDYRNEWCAMFTSWLFNQVGGIDKYIKSSTFAGDIARDSVAAGYGTWYEDECTDPSTVPAPGDVIVFDPYFGTYIPWPDNGKDKYYSSHVGYVYAVDDTYVYTVEGNSSDSVRTKQYNRKNHCNTYGLQGINGYFRPNY